MSTKRIHNWNMKNQLPLQQTKFLQFQHVKFCKINIPQTIYIKFHNTNRCNYSMLKWIYPKQFTKIEEYKNDLTLSHKICSAKYIQRYFAFPLLIKWHLLNKTHAPFNLFKLKCNKKYVAYLFKFSNTVYMFIATTCIKTF